MKPHITEDQHIREHELNLRLRALETEQRAITEAEKSRLKALHEMHCPKCGQRLSTEQYSSVEIDVCPSCRGVWLDASELETILADQTGLLRWCSTLLGGTLISRPGEKANRGEPLATEATKPSKQPQKLVAVQALK